MFIGQMAEIPYLAFLASGFVAFSATNTATFEGMWSVYTRMVPQQTYEAILATPTRVDDIVLGELLWCSTKGLFSGTAILIVGAVESWTAVLHCRSCS
jgi:lipooligosaccharide transport system permease protein